ncbi:MAG: CMP-N-acetylneuraminic acid synthetase [Bacteroidetes bacterium GWF2_43_63]|nr:MAG: CMP-N-acetylneuraminic acid synthetase [Bacteroidetes bacterium GWE2_42_42]OFY56047.1 MAG: CMP-N-acetylneuraminic acid synthetase [Bacteroidetes bacterium GWF2_43_63]HBG70705.1 acylneuraminate cytidylyltransferase family protein [Bacteroidales bacterium]HCB62467.1 acylneuraminate cytidylyltransferase family protein [Bacteroidales bacterium]HCY21922.1 acylneuraminate cytidylyltransferase family protein [Bacteroidales bacterium]
MEINDTLFIIPARGGSKGLPRKNILPINGKPMICYTIDAAQGVTSNNNICVSTDDMEIKKVVENYGLSVPFIRPAELASDTAGTREVLLHAIDFYRNHLNRSFSKICLLQATSPLRVSHHILAAHQLWSDDLDMVVSVRESKANPYFNLFEEQSNGFLKKSKEGNFSRRQEAPMVWEYNGAIYFINIQSLTNRPIAEFDKVRKFAMDDESSVDVDSLLDFQVAESIIRLGKNS